MTNQPKTLRHEAYDNVLTIINAGVHPFMVGPSGTGKTTIAKNVAEDKGLEFYYTGAVESAFQLRGFKDAHGNTVKTPFRTAYEEGGVFLFDEIDASDPQAIVSVHAALDNGVLDAPDGMVGQHENFHFIAAGNTWGHGASLEYMGRNALDGATLDRYVTTEVGYDPKLEKDIVCRLVGKKYLSWVNVVHQARKAVSDLEMRHIVSTRAAINGARLIKAGLKTEDVFNRTVLKGLDEDQIIQLTGRMEANATDTSKVVGVPRLEKLRKDMPRVYGLSDLVGDAEQALMDIPDIDQIEASLKQVMNQAAQVKRINASLERANSGSGRMVRAIGAAAQELRHG